MNRLFAHPGIWYRFDRSGDAIWHGDEGMHQMVVAPALRLLEDVRLTGSRAEFEAAIAHLRGHHQGQN